MWTTSPLRASWGHQVPTLMHSVYSAGASREALLKVADAVRYDLEVEKAVAHCAGLYLIRVSELSPAQ